MAYSEVDFTYSGGPQVFPTNFALGVLETDHIVVNVDGQVDGLGQPLSFAFTYNASNGEVTVTDALTPGWHGVIKRVTPVASLIVDFEANADVTKRNLSRSTKQVLMVVQELTDSREADSTAIQDTLEIVEELQADIADDVQAALDAAALAVTKANEAAASAAEALAKENSMLRDRGPWATLTLYSLSDLFTDSGNAYITQVAHIASNIAADLSAGRIRVFAAKGATGAGTGDMNNTDNLSGLTNKPLALATIGGQPLDSDLTAVAALGGTGLAVRTAANTWAQRQVTSGDGSLVVTNPDGVSGNIDIALADTWTSVAAVSIATGGSADIVIPATARDIVIDINNLSTNGPDPILQLLDSGTAKTSGYDANGFFDYGSKVRSTSAFYIRIGGSGRAVSGKAFLKYNASLGFWFYEQYFNESTAYISAATGWGWCTPVTNFSGLRLSVPGGVLDGAGGTMAVKYK